MGALAQFGLLIWKHILKRKRQPFVLLLEILWPVIIFLIVVGVRQTSLPTQKPTCHYRPRVLPSAGGVNFLQSFVCNLNNKCHDQEVTAAIPQQNQLAELASLAAPLMAKSNLTGSALLSDLPRTTGTLRKLQDTFQSPQVQQLLNIELSAWSLLRDPEHVLSYMTEVAGLSPDVATALLNATININKVYDLWESMDAENIVCDAKHLKTYLIFPSDVDVERVSKAVCGIEDGLIPDFVDTIQKQLDIAGITQLASQFSGAVGEHELSDNLLDVASMLGVLLKFKSLEPYLKDDVTIRSIPQWLSKAALYVGKVEERPLQALAFVPTILADIGPMFTEDQGTIESITKVIHALVAVTGITEGETTPVMTTAAARFTLPFAFDMEEKGLVIYLQEELQVPKTTAEYLTTLELNPQSMEYIANLLESSYDYYEVLCVSPGATSMFKAETEQQWFRLSQAAQQFCNIPNFHSVMENAGGRMTISSKIHEAVERSRGLDWVLMKNNTEMILQAVQDVQAILDPLVSSTPDIQEMWNVWSNALAKMYNGTYDEDWMTDATLWQLQAASMLISDHTAQYVGMIDATMDMLNVWNDNIIVMLRNIAEFVKSEATIRILKQIGDEEGLGAVYSILHHMLESAEILSQSADIEEYLMECNTQTLSDKMGVDLTADWGNTIIDFLCHNMTQTALNFQRPAEIAELVAIFQGQLINNTDVDFAKTYRKFRYYISNLDVKRVLMESWTKELPGAIAATQDMQTLDWMIYYDIEYQWRFLLQDLIQKYEMKSYLHVVATLGKAIQKTDIWPILEPFIRYSTLEFIYSNQLNSFLNEITSMDSTTGRLLHYMTTYSYEIITGLGDIITNRETRETFMESDNMIGTLCSYSELKELVDLSDMIPVEEIQATFCSISPDQIYAELKPLIDNFTIHMDDTFSEKPFDWDSFTELILQNVQLSNYNDNNNNVPKILSEMGTTMEKIQTAISVVTSSIDTTQMTAEEGMAFGDTFLSDLDLQWENDTAWNFLKYTMQSVQSAMVSLNDKMETIKDDGLLFADVFPNVTAVQDVVALSTEFPDMLTQMMDDYMNPAKVIDLMTSTDLMGSTFCQDVKVSDVMIIRDKDEGRLLDNIVCSMNMSQLLEAFTKTEYYSIINDMIESMQAYDSEVKVTMDWEAMIDSMNKMMATMTSIQESNVQIFPDIMGDDMVGMFQEMAENMTNSDMSKLYQGLDSLVPFLENISSDAAFSSAWQSMKSYIIQSNAMYEFINLHLAQWTGGKNITLLNYIKSEELMKLFTSLKSSPQELVNIVQSLTEVMQNPIKVSLLISANPQDICKDDQQFYAIFTIENYKVWKNIFCNMSSFNLENFLDEIQTSVEGLDVLISKFSASLEHNSGNISTVKFSDLVINTETYYNLLNHLMQYPPYFDIGVINPLMLSVDSWKSSLDSVESPEQTAADINRVLRTLAESMDALQNTGEPGQYFELMDEMNQVVKSLQIILEFANLQMGKLTESSSFDLVDTLDSAELRRLMDLAEHSQNLTAALLATVAKAVSNPSMMATLVGADWAVACDDLAVFSSVIEPAAEPSLDHATLQRIMCVDDLNVTLIWHQLMQNVEGFGDMFNKIAYMDQNGMAVNWTSFVITYLGFQKQLEEIIDNAPTFSVSEALVSPVIWNDIVQDFIKNIESSTDYSEALDYLQNLMPFASQILMMAGDEDMQVKRLLSQVDGAMVYLIEQLQPAVDGGLSVESLLVESPTTLDLLTFLNNSHTTSTALQVLITTLMLTPDQIQPLFSGEFDIYCQGNVEDKFVIGANQSQSFKVFLDKLCTTNFEAISDELQQVFDIDKLMEVIQNGSDISSDSLSTHYDQLAGIMAQLSVDLPHLNIEYALLDPSLWLTVAEVVQSFDISTLLRSAQVDTAPLLEILARDYPAHAWMITTYMTYIQGSAALMDFLSIQLAIINGTGSFSLGVESEELQRILLAVEHSPDVTTVLLHTVAEIMKNPNKASELSQIDPMAICSDAASFTGIFQAPANSNIDMDKVQQSVCLVDFNMTKLMNELVYEVEGLSALVQAFGNLDASNYSSTDLTVFSMRFAYLLESLLHNTGVTADFGIDVGLMSPERWNQILGNFSSNLPSFDTQQISELFSDVIPMIEGLFILTNETKDLHNVIARADDVIVFIIENFKPLIGANITLNESLKDAPEALRLARGIQYLPVLFEVILNTLLFKPEGIPLDFFEGNFMAFCRENAESIFEIPASKLQQFLHIHSILCSTNFTTVADELSGAIDMNMLLEKFMSLEQGAANITSFILHQQELVDVLTAVSEDLPRLDVDLRWLDAALWESLFTDVSTWQNNTVFNTVIDASSSIQTFLENSIGSAGSSPEIQQLLGALNALTDVTTILNNVAKNPMKLFAEKVEIGKLIAAMPHMPDFVETIVLTMFEPQKPFDNIDDLCNTDLESVLKMSVNKDFNITSFQTLLCSINMSALLIEIQDIATIISVPWIEPDVDATSVNLTGLLYQIHSLTETLTASDMADVEAAHALLPWLNVTAWTHLVDTLTTTAFALPSQPDSIKQYLGSLENAVNFVNLTVFYPTVHTISAVVDIISTLLSPFVVNVHEKLCFYQTFSAQCSNNATVVIDSAKYGRMGAGVCGISDEIGSIGCYQDVKSWVEETCSKSSTCEFDVSALDQYLRAAPSEAAPAGAICPAGLEAYLDVIYSCSETNNRRLEDLVPSSTELMKLVSMMDDIPGALHIALLSLPTTQFQELLTSDAVLSLCSGSGHLRDYVTAPRHSTLNISLLQHQICNLNISLLQQEIIDVLDIELIRSQAENYNPINWTETYMKFTSLIDVMERIGQPSNKLKIDNSFINEKVWLETIANETAWDKLLTDWETSANDIISLSTQLETLTTGFEDDTTIHMILEVLNTGVLLQIAQQEQVEMQADNVTISHVLIHTLRTMNGGALDYLCNGGAVDFPSETFSVDNLINLLCSFDEDVLPRISPSDSKTEDLLNIIEQITNGTYAPSGVTFEDVATNMQALLQMYMNLGSNMHEFELDVSLMEEYLVSFYSKIDVSNIHDLTPVLEQLLLSLFGLGDLPSQYSSVFQVLMDYVTSVMQTVAVQNSALDIGSLFSDVTSIKNIMNLTFGLQPDMITAMLNSSVKFEKLSQLMNMSPQMLGQLACDGNKMNEYFILDSSINEDILRSTFCGFNATVFIQDIMDAFDIANLMAEVTAAMEFKSVNTTVLETSISDLLSEIMRLSNATDLVYGGRSVSDLLNIPSVPHARFWTDFQRYLTNITTASDIDVSGITALVPTMEGSQFWDEILPIMAATNVIVEVINKQITSLNESVALNDLLSDSVMTLAYLFNLLDMAPDIVADVLEAKIDLAQIVQLDTWESVGNLFCNDSAVQYTSDRNRTALIRAICQADWSALSWQFMDALDAEKITQQFMNVASRNSSAFNMEEFLINYGKLQTNVDVILSSLDDVKVPEFLKFQDDWTNWLSRMDEAIQFPAKSDKDTLLWLGQWLNTVSASLESEEFWNTTLPILNVINMVAEGTLNATSKTTALNITFADLIKDEEQFLEYLEMEYSIDQDLILLLLNTTLDVDQLLSKLDMETLTVGDISDLVCGDNSIIPPEVNVKDLKDILCDNNMNDLQLKLTNILNMDDIVNKLMVLGGGTSVRDFDWTQFLSNAYAVQSQFPDMPTVALGLARLFRADSALPTLEQHLQSVISSSSNLDEAALVSVLKESMEAIVVALNDTLTMDAETAHIFRSITTITNVISERLDRIAAGGVSISALFGDVEEVAAMMHHVLQLDSDDIRAFLNISLLPDMIPKLVTSEGLEGLFCNETSALAAVSTKDLQKSICSANLTYLALQLEKSFNVKNVLNEMSQLAWPIDWRGIVDNSTNSGLELLQLILSLTQQPPTVDEQLTGQLTGQLTELLNVTLVMDIMQSIVQQQVEENIPEIVTSMMRALQDIPGFDQVIVAVSQMTEILDSQMGNILNGEIKIADVLTNSTALANLYKTLIMNYPDLQSMLQADLQYKPLLETLSEMSMTKALVCNNTVMSDLLWDIDSIARDVNVTQIMKILCEQEGHVWYEQLKGAGMSPTDIFSITDKLVSALDSAGIEYRMDPSSPGSVDWTGLGTQLEGLMRVFEQMSILPEGVVPHENISHWQSVITDIMQATSDTSLQMMTQHLNMMDSILKDFDFWQTIKKYTYAFSTFMEYANKQIGKLQDMEGTIKLENILPDPESANALLSKLISENATKALLSLSLKPDMMMKFLDASSWPGIMCDREQFNEMFTWDEYQDIYSLQEDWCDALKNNTTLVKHITDLFNLTGIVQEIDRILMDGTLSENPWQLFTDQIEVFMRNMAAMGSISPGETGQFEGILGQLTDSLSLLSGNVNNMSSVNVCAMLNWEYIDISYQINYGVNYANWIVTLLGKLPEIVNDAQSLTCDLPNLNFTTFYGKLKQSRLWSIGEEIFVVLNDQSMIPKVSCPQYMQNLQDLQDMFTATSQKIENNATYIMECVVKNKDKVIPVFSDINEMLTFLGDIQTLISEAPIVADLELEDIQPILDMLLKGFIKQEPVAVEFGELLNNVSSFSDFLQQSAEMTPAVIQAFLGATFDLDSNAFVNHTSDGIVRLLCNASELAGILSIYPAEGVNLTTVSQQLCGDDVDDIATVLKNSLNLTNILLSKARATVPNYIQDTIWIGMLINDVNQLVIDLDRVISFASLVNEFDMDTFLSLLPSLAKFLTDGGTETVIDDIEQLLENLKDINDDPLAQMIIADLQTFANGLRGLSFVVDYMPSKVLLKDLVKSSDYVEEYLEATLGIDEIIAKQLLDASISWEKMLSLHAADIPGHICDEQWLSELLNVSRSSSVDIMDIISEMCVLDEQTVVNVTSLILQEIDIREYIEQMLSVNADIILKNNNMSEADIKEIQNMVEAFQPLTSSFNEISKRLGNLTKSISLPENNDVSPISVQSTMRSASALLCGDSSSASVEDEYGIFGTDPSVQTSNQTVWTPQQQQEISQLPTEFCVDLYKEMQNLGDLGKIMWSLVKPLIRGTILYTPDNDVTRAIMTEASWLINGIDEVNNLARNWIDSSENLKGMGNNGSGLEALKAALKNPFVNAAMTEMMGTDGWEIVNQMESLSDLASQDTSQLNSLAYMVHNFTECFNLNLQAVGSERDLVLKGMDLREDNKLLAGVVFLGMETLDRRRRQAEAVSIPDHVRYKIRMDQNAVPPTDKWSEMIWRPGPEDNFVTDLEYMRGFLPLQDMIDQAIVKLKVGSDAQLPNIAVKQMPYPCYEDDPFQYWISQYYFPVLMTIAWLVAVAVAVSTLVADKETGVEHALKVMGMREGVSWAAWFAVTLISMVVMVLVLTVLVTAGKLMGRSDFILLFLFFSTFCLSITAMCYMVSAFFYRSTLGAMCGMIVYMTSYLPYIIVAAVRSELYFWQNILLSLSSTTAFSYGCQLITTLEIQGKGLGWDDTDTELYDGYTFRWSCYMMLIDSAIYLLIGWYFKQVIPAKYVHAQPWYFPFSPLYWGCVSPTTTQASKYNFSNYGTNYIYDDEAPEGIKNISLGYSEGVGEADPVDLPLGMSLHHLSKVYKGGNAAVNDLTVNFYQGQVTVLLGQNGAGKSTTIHMLTGVFRPTSGTAFVNGNNIITDSEAQRNHLGFCPQHDVLIEHMTVYEHLRFFMKLKKVKNSIIQQEISKMLDLIDMRSCIHVKASELSGGQRRRLSVALAFTGKSEVVILDEPTSGVDPAARRNIWDIITHFKKDRTILLTTHHLDEAEVIGDRIVIIHKGKLVCSGSPMFLKSEYGSGYHLTVAKSQPASHTRGNVRECKSSEVLSNIQLHIPSARLVEEVGMEMSFILPATKGRIAAFPALFNHLDAAKNQLGIHKYGISDNTLEEVFLKVILSAEKGIELDPAKLKTQTLSDLDNKYGADESTSDVVEAVTSSTMPKYEKISGGYLKCRQFTALLAKRWHHHRRDGRTYLTQFLLPLLFIVLAMVCTLIKPTPVQPVSIALTPDIYGPENNLFFRQLSDAGINLEMVETLTREPGPGTTCMYDSTPDDHRRQCSSAPGDWVSPSDSIQPAAKSKYENPEDCTCESGGKYTCPEGAGGLPPPYMSLGTRDNLVNLTGNVFTTEQYLLRTHHDNLASRYGGWSVGGDSEQGMQSTVWFNNKGWHALPSFYNGHSNMMLRANLLHTGQADWSTIPNHGITVYNHPINSTQDQLSQFSLLQGVADTGIAVTILTAMCFIPASFTIYVIHERIHQEKQLQLIYGVGSALYWFTMFFWDMVVYTLVSGVATGIAAAFGIAAFTYNLNLAAFFVLLLLFGWATIPLTYLLSGFFKNVSVGFVSVFILHVFAGINTTTCTFFLHLFEWNGNIQSAYTLLKKVFLIFPQFCLGDGLVTLSYNQLVTDVYRQFDVDKYESPFTFGMLGWQYVALGIQGLVLFTLVLIRESSICAGAGRGKSKGDYKEDSDVSLERQRVVTGEARDDLLVLNNLSKRYWQGMRRVRAVNNLCLAIPKGECFGLLGVNGAGKTTTFKMITGNTEPSSGAAVFKGKIISKNPSNIEQNIGYCPQFDALDNYLTGKECLTLFAKLKGIPDEYIAEICQNLAERFGLKEHLNKVVKSYSGGNKRKLSAAGACLGDPELVMLDEPTTGMDPKARRLVWNNILEIIRDKRSVVLTSHSMEECDALCTRMAIMVNGQTMCLGSGQHLKNKFGGGYILKMRCLDGGRLEYNTGVICDTFPGTKIKYEHLNMVELEVPSDTISLGAVFHCLEGYKQQLGIVDYTLSQTTLDQVFVHFARQQTDGRCEGSEGGEGGEDEGHAQAYSNAAYEHWPHDDRPNTPHSNYKINISLGADKTHTDLTPRHHGSQTTPFSHKVNISLQDENDLSKMEDSDKGNLDGQLNSNHKINISL